MSDGVQVILLWFEGPGIKPDAPCVISLHGIGETLAELGGGIGAVKPSPYKHLPVVLSPALSAALRLDAGGDEHSVRPIMLAEECLKRGWRRCVNVCVALCSVGRVPGEGCTVPEATHVSCIYAPCAVVQPHS